MIGQCQVPTATELNVSRHEVSIGGRPVIYRVAGAGDPLVLVHGLSGSSRWWWKNVPELARHYTVYLVDLPGFGEMRGDLTGFVLREAAEWLCAWMRKAAVPRASFIGHSLGGYVCIRLASEIPSVVNRLVLVAPAGSPTGRSLVGYAGPLLRAARQLRPRFATVLAHDFLRAGPLTTLRAARDLLREDIVRDLDRVQAPALFVWGGADPMIPSSIGYALRSRHDQFRLLCLEGVGHVPMIERPDEFNHAVLAFIRGEDVGE